MADFDIWRLIDLYYIEDKRTEGKTDFAGMEDSFDPLKCHEDLPSSPGCHMDYGTKKNHITYIEMTNYTFLPQCIFCVSLMNVAHLVIFR